MQKLLLLLPYPFPHLHSLLLSCSSIWSKAQWSYGIQDFFFPSVVCTGVQLDVCAWNLLPVNVSDFWKNDAQMKIDLLKIWNRMCGQNFSVLSNMSATGEHFWDIDIWWTAEHCWDTDALWTAEAVMELGAWDHGTHREQVPYLLLSLVQRARDSWRKEVPGHWVNGHGQDGLLPWGEWRCGTNCVMCHQEKTNLLTRENLV